MKNRMYIFGFFLALAVASVMCGASEALKLKDFNEETHSNNIDRSKIVLEKLQEAFGLALSNGDSEMTWLLAESKVIDKKYDWPSYIIDRALFYLSAIQLDMASNVLRSMNDLENIYHYDLPKTELFWKKQAELNRRLSEVASKSEEYAKKIDEIKRFTSFLAQKTPQVSAAPGGPGSKKK